MQDYVIIIIGVVWFLIIGLMIFLFIYFGKRTKVKEAQSDKEKYDRYIENFGGRENIISATAVGSRLSLVLKDYDIVNLEELNKLGITSSIKMSNKITFVIGSLASDIAKYINNLKA
jgi:phosphotransferase system IIB component